MSDGISQSSQRLQELRERQCLAWQRGERPFVESLIADLTPTLTNDEVLELIFAEVMLRAEHGEVGRCDEYQQRFPQLADSLKRLFAIREVLESQSDPSKELTKLAIDSKPVEGFESTLLSELPELAQTVIPENGNTLVTSSSTRDLTFPQIGRYEIIAEIARGGMGVVYKAFDRQLDRVVALKLIKSGELADKEAVQRFQIEAQAAGHLDHPGIVQVYEVGQQGQQHYLAMAYVDGQSLWQCVKESPLKPREAANIMRQVAEAIHYAHREGIIHRDLKPQNILLTKDGNPKVTDFGLAKRQESDSSLTATGQVMGTPSFMPPEQVTGKTDEIGHLADVYSLGATLYCLLTGRPPFQAATVLETMQQVIERTPVSPRLLNPSVDRDLETICLKCLEKKPANRLSSAKDLAEELGRFLRGESILSRPVSPVTRMWRWARRNPLGTALIAAMFVVIAAVGVSVVVVQQAKQASELTGLKDRLQVLIEKPELSANYLELGENLISQMSKLAPPQTEPAETRLWGAYADLIDQNLKRTEITPGDLEQLKAPLELLSTRIPRRANELRDLLRRRTQTWQKVFVLNSPFSNLREYFADQRLQVVDQVLEAKSTIGSDSGSTVSTIRSTSTGKGPMKFEAVFDERWQAAKQLTLELSASDQLGYRFTLFRTNLMEPMAATVPQESAIANETPQQRFHVRFDRNGKILSEQRVSGSFDVYQSRLTMSVTRQGRKLAIQLGTATPIVFEDPFPIAGTTELRFGVGLTKNVGIEQLTTSQMYESAVVPLERGDGLYDAGKWEEALSCYREQELNVQQDQSLSARETVAECQYKQALCLIEAGRLEEATSLLETGFKVAQSRWAALAGTQLWVQLLRQKRQDDADAILDRLNSSTSDKSQVATLVPDEIRREILSAYRSRRAAGMVIATSFQPAMLRQMELLILVDQLLSKGDEEHLNDLNQLRRTYFGIGQFEDAARINQQMMSLRDSSVELSFEIRIERVRGNLAGAMELLKKYKIDDEGRVRIGEKQVAVDYGAYLRMERVYCLAALKDWDQIEREIVPLKRELRNSKGPESWRVFLMQYYLLRQRGDLQAARDVLREALTSSDGQGNAGQTTEIRISGARGTPEIFCLRGLWGDIQEQELRATLRKFDGDGAGTLGSIVTSVIRTESLLNPMNELFRSSKGLANVDKIILDQGTESERLKVFLTRLVVEYARENAFERDLSQSQEQVLELMAAELFFSARQEDSFTTTQLLPLAATWKGVASVLGWKGIAKSLPPKRRQYFAYLFAHRFLTLNNTAQAIEFLKEINTIQAGDDDVVKLARNDLDLLTKKNGLLEIQNEHARNLQVTVQSPGQEAKLLEVAGNMGIASIVLSEGEYDLELAEPIPGVELRSKRISIKPGRHRVTTILSAWKPGIADQTIHGLVDRPARFPGICRWQMVLAEPDRWTALAVNPDGLRVALGDDEGFVRVHNLSDFSRSQVFPAKPCRVTSLEWNARGDTVAAASIQSSKIRLWNSNESRLGPVLHGQRMGIQCLAWSPRADLLASGGFWEDGTIHILDPSQATGLISLDLSFVRALAWSPNGQRIAVGSMGPTLRIYSHDLQPTHESTNPNSEEVFALAWTPDGNRLASSTNHLTNVHRFTSDGMSVITSYQSGMSAASNSWDRSGNRLLIGQSNGTVKCLALATEKLECLWETPPEGVDPRVAWLNSSEPSAVALQDSHLKTWDAKGVCTSDYKPGPGLLTSVSLSPDGTILSGRQTDGRVGLYDLSGHCLRILPGVHSRYAPLFSPDGQKLAIADDVLRRIRIFHTGSDHTQQPEFNDLSEPTGQVQSISWNDDSQQLAVCLEDGKVWISPLDKTPATMISLPVLAQCVAWQRGGTRLAIATRNTNPTRILYWDSETKKVEADAQVFQPGAVIFELEWSPDGHSLAAAMHRGSIQIFDSNGRSKVILHEQIPDLADLCWSDDGRSLSAVGSERTCRIWTFDGDLKPSHSIETRSASRILALSEKRNEMLLWSRTRLERWSLNPVRQLQRVIIWPDDKFLEIRDSGAVLRSSPEARDRIRFLVELPGQRLETWTWQQFEDRIGMPLDADATKASLEANPL